MSEVEKQEGQKTVVAFIAGLLIGGLLVWVFSAPQTEETPDTETGAEVSETEGGTDVVVPTGTANGAEDDTAVVSTPTLPVGEGNLSVRDQAAGAVVELASAEFPTADGWVAIRDYESGVVGGILGAARYSQSQGLIPESVELLRATESGKTYAAVFFTEDGEVDGNGKLTFDPAGDQQIDGILTSFLAE